MSALKSGELFAGVGGLGRAVDEVFGSSPAWFAEFDAAPSKVLAHHYPDVPNYGDVTRIDFRNVEHTHVRAGGFPCTDVSLAGRRAGLRDGTRSGLWSEFARSIAEDRPDWVVIENVRGLLSADATGDVEPCPWCLADPTGEHALRALGAVLGDLAELGFDAEWTGLRAADVGAPHGRFRVFILAWPSENTGSGRGRRGAVASGRGEGTRADVASDGPDSRDDGTPESLTLLPTPLVSDGTGGSKNIAESGFSPQMRDIAKLLPTPGAYDDAPVGSDQGGDGGRADRDLTRAEVFAGDWGDWPLLPTPVAQPSGNSPEDHLRKKPGREVVTDLAIMAENDLIASGGRLLPTPGAYDGERGGSQHPDKRRDGGHSVTIQDVAENLLPTPRASRGAAATETMYRLGAVRDDEGDAQGNVTMLLPTPTAADSSASGGAVGSSNVTLTDATARAVLTTWGPYEPAIRRWESVIGRPAPSPVRMDGKGGKARLNPELPEWMMGWPEGWVTAPEIGLSRSEQLKAVGNGVCTLQAVAALRSLLNRPGVPALASLSGEVTA